MTEAEIRHNRNENLAKLIGVTMHKFIPLTAAPWAQQQRNNTVIRDGNGNVVAECRDAETAALIVSAVNVAAAPASEADVENKNEKPIKIP